MCCATSPGTRDGRCGTGWPRSAGSKAGKTTGAGGFPTGCRSGSGGDGASSLLGAGHGSMTAVPDVTVVIPTRDRAETVPRAVAAALGQEAVAVEVVVVDDGSTDGTSSRLRHD